MDTLSSSYLFEQVRAIAGAIGPRPAGKRAEMQARQYIRHALTDAGIQPDQIEEQPFMTPDSWGYGVLGAAFTIVAGNLLGRLNRWLGIGLTAIGTYAMYGTVTGRRQVLPLDSVSGPSANLIVRIPAQGKAKRKIVLIGHTDSNKHRLTFLPETKKYLRPFSSSSLILAGINLAAQFLGLKKIRDLTTLAAVGMLPSVLLDEMNGFVDGANDNATAVACLLGIGGQLQQTPLKNSEVWLAFTGAEESGCIGMQHLLNKYREELADAWFIDFEMVGAGDIVYITHHSGLTMFTGYEPDDESLALAVETARENPEMGVRGVPMVITEEVSTLRSRGFRGLCLAGMGEDGWLVNWHQFSDNVNNITPECIEKAARFAWAMMQKLDERV